jgi:5-methylthioadenosine/S-adenosylhomocysteine deaminase
LDSLGALGPLTVAAHCLWLDERDIDLLAERGVAIVHNPASNMKLASGPALDYEAARSRGIRVALGTDGAASNDGLDLFADMRLAGLLQKHEHRDARRFPVEEILESATATGHRLLGTGAGRVEEGAAADIVLVDLTRPAMVPCHDIAANLVYSGAGSCVDTVLCAGKVVVRKGRMRGAEEIVAEARSRAESLAETRLG